MRIDVHLVSLAFVALAFAASPRADAAPLTGITAIAAGSFHTCALTASGGVKCWGSNVAGQLGDGTTTDRRAPVDVSGIASGAIAISAGGSASCALMADGTGRCWGQMSEGAPILTPANLIWPAPLASLSTNGGLCLLDGAGAIACSAVPIPAEPAYATGNRAVISRPGGACFITATNGVRCVGENFDGQLGDGTTTSSTAASVEPVGLSGGVASLAANGLYACAVTIGGGVKCWGRQGGNSISYLPPTPSPSTPADVGGLAPGVTAVAIGAISGYRVNSAIFVTYSHACALNGAGGVQCWGTNSSGQLGNGSTTASFAPVDVAGLDSGALAIAAGADHTCALVSSGEVRCWGANGSGQLGDGASSGAAGPVEVIAAGTVRSVSAGTLHTCVVTTAGGAKCWGRNRAGTVGGSSFAYGTLGDGSSDDKFSPVDVTGLASGVTSISAGDSNTCARLESGGLKCWGFNNFGDVGDGTTTTRLTPVDVAGLTAGMSTVAAGRSFGCAVSMAGAVSCWGLNGSGELGDGTTNNRPSPLGVFGLGGGVLSITTGSSFACARQATGGVVCWGSGGQLGDGSTANRPFPGPVAGLPASVEIVAGGGHACARDTVGGVRCWGVNGAGQVGDGTTTERNFPVVVDGLLSGTIAMAAGSGFTCAVATGGGVRCWGSNQWGQLGDGTTTPRSTPITVRGLPEAVTSISAGVAHACAVTRSNRLFCWGDNSVGQLGVESSGVSRAVPGPVRAGIAVAVSKSGTGAGLVMSNVGGIDCGVACTADLPPGTVITLTASPNAGSTFVGWAGDCTGTVPCVLAVDSARRVEAVFAAPRLVNIATRLKVLEGDDVLIGGFTVAGALPKTVVIRARGPSLAPLIPTGTMGDPKLDLYVGGTPIASNDDWGAAANAQAVAASGFAPSHPKESAILVKLEPGQYTAIVSGIGGDTGVGIVEVFEVDTPEMPLSNIATRGRVSGGDDVMIGGFIIQGAGPQTVIVRARGPSLAPFGITSFLGDPVLQLYSGQTVIASNDDWQQAANAAAIQSAGFAPVDAKEAAILITLPPGAYTAIMSGKNGATGVGIIEVFAVLATP